tara:strand:+ start:1671 stop:1898 length:228 start_codon:yes stop_codon:yes gene_type:complete
MKVLQILTETGWSFIDESAIVAVTLIKGKSAEIHLASGTIFTTQELQIVRDLDIVKISNKDESNFELCSKLSENM